MSAQHSRSGSGSSGDLVLVDAPGLKRRSCPTAAEMVTHVAVNCGLDGEERKREGERPRRAAAAAAAALRRSWRRWLSAALALILTLVLLTQHRQLYRHAQDVAASGYYNLDPAMLGRSEAAHPAPHCCHDEACAFTGAPGQRAAVVTYLRDDTYLPLLQQLECTLRRSNPGLELALMHVPGEMSAAGMALARALNLTLLPVAPLEFPNTYESRYGLNWLKVRALGLTQYHSVLLVDSDVAVTGSVAPLFGLPAEFAAVWDQYKWLNRYRTMLERINGGVFLLRPCKAVEAHMLRLLERHPKLRFVHGAAEQDFFGWYYRYTGTTLPMQWNCQAEQCLDGNLTVGGAQPRIIHYTSNKPMVGPQPGEEGHQFLCSLDELETRAAGATPGRSSDSGSGSSGAPSQQL